MARVQTRKSVSMNKDVFKRATDQATAEGMSVSGIVVKALCEKYGWPLPEITSSRHQPKQDPASDEERQREYERVQAQLRRLETKSAKERTAEILKRADMAERRALANPCRRNKCRIEGLHEAHE